MCIPDLSPQSIRKFRDFGSGRTWLISDDVFNLPINKNFLNYQLALQNNWQTTDNHSYSTLITAWCFTHKILTAHT